MARRRKRDSVSNLAKTCITGTCPQDVYNKATDNTLADRLLRWLSGFIYLGGLGISSGRGGGGTTGYTPLGGGTAESAVVPRPTVPVTSGDLIPLDVLVPSSSSVFTPAEAEVAVGTAGAEVLLPRVPVATDAPPTLRPPPPIAYDDPPPVLQLDPSLGGAEPGSTVDIELTELGGATEPRTRGDTFATEAEERAAAAADDERPPAPKRARGRGGLRTTQSLHSNPAYQPAFPQGGTRGSAVVIDAPADGIHVGGWDDIALDVEPPPPH